MVSGSRLGRRVVCGVRKVSTHRHSRLSQCWWDQGEWAPPWRPPGLPGPTHCCRQQEPAGPWAAPCPARRPCLHTAACTRPGAGSWGGRAERAVRAGAAARGAEPEGPLRELGMCIPGRGPRGLGRGPGRGISDWHPDAWTPSGLPMGHPSYLEEARVWVWVSGEGRGPVYHQPLHAAGLEVDPNPAGPLERRHGWGCTREVGSVPRAPGAALPSPALSAPSLPPPPWGRRVAAHQGMASRRR